MLLSYNYQAFLYILSIHFFDNFYKYSNSAKKEQIPACYCFPETCSSLNLIRFIPFQILCQHSNQILNITNKLTYSCIYFLFFDSIIADCFKISLNKRQTIRLRDTAFSYPMALERIHFLHISKSRPMKSAVWSIS